MGKRSRKVVDSVSREIGKKAAKRQELRQPDETIPHVGHPLDGSQYHNIIEEQVYSEQRPGPSENKPHRSE